MSAVPVESDTRWDCQHLANPGKMAGPQLTLAPLAFTIDSRATGCGQAAATGRAGQFSTRREQQDVCNSQ